MQNHRIRQANDQSSTSGRHGALAGNMVFSGNHTELLTSFTPASLRPRKADAEHPGEPDNIFAMATGLKGGDFIISCTRTFTDDGPELFLD